MAVTSSPDIALTISAFLNGVVKTNVSCYMLKLVF